MERTRYLQLLAADGEALASAASRDLHARVPSCPEWDTAELVRHVGRIHRHKSGIVRAGGAEFRPGFETSRDELVPEEGVLLHWYRAGLRELIGSLSSRDPDASAWSWAGDHRVAFWNRRMAQETAVHRWDAENAAGRPDAIDAELAADGVGELFATFVRLSDVRYEGRPGGVELRCTDASAAWTVTLARGAVATHAAGGSGSPGAVVRAGASDLLLFVWRRLGPDDVEISGNRALVEALWRYLEEPTI